MTDKSFKEQEFDSKAAAAGFLQRVVELKDRIESIKTQTLDTQREALSLAVDIRQYAASVEKQIPPDARDEFIGTMKGLEHAIASLAGGVM